MEKKEKIIQLYDEIIQEFLTASRDLKSQSFFLKEKKQIIDKILNLSKHLDELVNEIQS